VLVARDGGAATVSSQKKEARQTAEREVRDMPAVQAIMKAFPGAEIVKVREPENFVAIEQTTEETDEESR
jgi:DNA polymerase III subunit gamma/tau